MRRYPTAFAVAARVALLVPARWWTGRDLAVVRALQPASDVDMAKLFRDDELWAALSAVLAPALARDFQCVAALSLGVTTYAGLAGLRSAWLDWLKPWTTYRTEVEEIRPLAPKVVVLYRNYGRLESSADEIETRNAAVWGFRDGRLARAEFYTDRTEALKVIGRGG